jgi:hypothetical protein
MADQVTIYHWPAGESGVCFARAGRLWGQENYPILDGAYWAECSMCRRPGVVVTDQDKTLDFMPPGTRLSEDGKTMILEFGNRDPEYECPACGIRFVVPAGHLEPVLCSCQNFVIMNLVCDDRSES